MSEIRRRLMGNRGLGPLDIELYNPSGVHVGFTSLIKSATGRLRCYWREGTAHGSDNGTVKQAWADYPYRNWTLEADLETSAIIYTSASDGDSGLLLASGNMLRWYRQGTSADDSAQGYLKISTDGGATWGSVIDPGNMTSAWWVIYGRGWEAGGNLYQPCHGQNTSETRRSFLIRSTDAGATWAFYATIAHDTVSYGETAIFHKDASNKIAIVRNDSSATFLFKRVVSADGGATWGSPTELSIYGNCPSALVHPVSGKFYLFWRDRQGSSDDTADTVYATSTDDGVTWSASTIIRTNYGGWDGGHPSTWLVQDAAGNYYAAVSYYTSKGDSGVAANRGDAIRFTLIPIS
jgi:hypothetical protein